MEDTPPCAPTRAKGDASPLSLPAARRSLEMGAEPVQSAQDGWQQDLWEAALLCDAAPEGSDEDCSSSEEEEEAFAQPRCKKPIMVQLPCGDIHICGRGRPCRYAAPNEDRLMVCIYSGVEFCPETTEEFFDLNGGIGKKSGDPDANCGEPVFGRFQRRLDPVSASRAAYQAANNFSDSDVAFVPLGAGARERQCKRGALCVGETDEPSTSKRGRASKKNVSDSHTRSGLLSEAESVLFKLINHKRAACFKRKSEGERAERPRPPQDERMCDSNFVFATSVKKYIRNCLTNGATPSLDAVHNLALMAQDVSARARAALERKEDDCIHTAKFRSLFCGIVVALWSACCESSYMRNSKRGSDAFRPFVCGVCYGSKRGVALADGAYLVPRSPQLAAALPVLRGTGGNALAKQLHQSSHRGLCTLSRCIASVPPERQKQVFGDVARMAARFSKERFFAGDV